MTCNKQLSDPWHKNLSADTQALSHGHNSYNEQQYHGVCPTPFCDSVAMVMMQMLHTHTHTPASNTPVPTQFKCWYTDCFRSSSLVSRAQKESQVLALLSSYRAQRHGDSNSPSGYTWTDIFLKLTGWAFLWQDFRC